MIEFQTEPDPIFLAILTEALAWTREELYPYVDSYQATQEEVASLDEQYPIQHPHLSRYFSREEAREQVERLRAALGDETLYRLSDYHWLILYVSLSDFADLHNDGALDPDGRVGSYIIDTIDADHIVETFFFDTDFLLGPEFLVADERRIDVVPDVTPEARKIAAGIKPDPEDLALTPIEPSESEMSPGEATRYPAAGYIGPYPMLEPDAEA